MPEKKLTMPDDPRALARRERLVADVKKARDEFVARIEKLYDDYLSEEETEMGYATNDAGRIAHAASCAYFIGCCDETLHQGIDALVIHAMEQADDMFRAAFNAIRDGRETSLFRAAEDFMKGRAKADADNAANAAIERAKAMGAFNREGGDA